jgi:FK506-binding nuclear protein
MGKLFLPYFLLAELTKQSLTLIPGELTPPYSRTTTNTQQERPTPSLSERILGEDLKDNNGRSVIKVTHEPLPAAFFEASDSEDEDDSDMEGDLPSDEFELDSEEGFRKIVKDAAEAAKNGDIPAEDDEDEDFEDDEDEDEDEDDEDMDSEDDDELLETTVLAALTAGKVRVFTRVGVDND